ncbi:glutamic acid-rich region [Reticulomyxa filosa]|uniref:Glutamic acid-rich region n=1 Tax=Reticulomyxa filosa TaxID=46433 RepID=X6N5G2_RETFI|nr:glutamic acid-rich region [Reticulomyxa filosa]|eukprot:ETO21256.1 glutamic acid-rich region [Reticulomyxa filosa]
MFVSSLLLLNIQLVKKKKKEHIVGGSFESHFNAFSWPGIELETQCILQPYITDPEYLSHTHVFVEFTNASKSSQVIGYATISLLNAFPIKLLARIDEMKEQLFEKNQQATIFENEKRNLTLINVPEKYDSSNGNNIEHKKSSYDQIGKIIEYNNSQYDEIEDKKNERQDKEEKRKERLIQKRIEEQQRIDKNKHKKHERDRKLDTSQAQPHNPTTKTLDISRVKRDANAPKNFEVPILLYGKLVGAVCFIFYY